MFPVSLRSDVKKTRSRVEVPLRSKRRPRLRVDACHGKRIIVDPVEILWVKIGGQESVKTAGKGAQSAISLDLRIVSRISRGSIFVRTRSPAIDTPSYSLV